MSITAITEMPESLRYDLERHTVIVGDGEFYPVRPAVWAYAVGSKNVIKSWFNYRKKDPGGRRSSPLDGIHPTVWDPAWTRDLLDLLTVLTRLVDLESAQEEILADVLAAPVLSRKALQVGGTLWPDGPKDRKPRRSLAGNATPGTLDI